MEVLAEGPTIGFPSSLIKSCVISSFGQRNAAVGSPPVTASGKVPSLTKRIIVNGPGQKCLISFLARSGTSLTYFSIISSSDTVTINGLSLGRPLAAYTLLTAFSLVANAPSPYTVSVGKATNFPFLNRATASGICSLFKIFVSITSSTFHEPFLAYLLSHP